MSKTIEEQIESLEFWKAQYKQNRIDNCKFKNSDAYKFYRWSFIDSTFRQFLFWITLLLLTFVIYILYLLPIIPIKQMYYICKEKSVTKKIEKLKKQIAD